jgi:hypothetical protein
MFYLCSSHIPAAGLWNLRQLLEQNHRAADQTTSLLVMRIAVSEFPG